MPVTLARPVRERLVGANLDRPSGFNRDNSDVLSHIESFCTSTSVSKRGDRETPRHLVEVVLIEAGVAVHGGRQNPAHGARSRQLVEIAMTWGDRGVVVQRCTAPDADGIRGSADRKADHEKLNRYPPEAVEPSGSMSEGVHHSTTYGRSRIGIGETRARGGD